MDDVQQKPTNELDNMPTYISSKIIQAIPMTRGRFFARKGENVESGGAQPGYLVKYPDGYLSWSPEEVFEETCREINLSEAAMCCTPGV
ncbi:MAG TPA: hypothetical protein ENH82_07715 [bacterium]|nr:hypothetical protein [bacterium]